MRTATLLVACCAAAHLWASGISQDAPDMPVRMTLKIIFFFVVTLFVEIPTVGIILRRELEFPEATITMILLNVASYPVAFVLRWHANWSVTAMWFLATGLEIVLLFLWFRFGEKRYLLKSWPTMLRAVFAIAAANVLSWFAAKLLMVTPQRDWPVYWE